MFHFADIAIICMTVSDVFNGAFAGSLRACVQKSHDGSATASASPLTASLESRDGILELLPSKLSLTRNDVTDVGLINFICTA
jgi:hypothetical protein